MTDPDHTFFILNLARVYVERIQAAIYDADCLEVLRCDELTRKAKTLDWMGNLFAIIADIEKHITSGALPKPFEQHHLLKLAASRGFELETRQGETKGLYHLFETASGTYLKSHPYHSDDEITFTEWEAYNHLLNRPAIA